MHLYQLQRYSGATSKHRCPQCQNRRKTFSLYINTQTNEPLNPDVGKCDREVKCGYHFKPREYFESGAQSREPGVSYPKFIFHTPGVNTPDSRLKTLDSKTSYIPNHIFKASLSRYDQNNLVEYLKFVFGNTVTEQLVARYLIGTSKHWHGATVFWQVDIKGNKRTGKVMLYNPTNAKRVKLPFNHITWVHTLLKRCETSDMRYETKKSNLNTQVSHLKSDYNLTQCFFGEHLLQDTTKPVAVVESEKTAVIASALMPDYIWIATGGLSNLTPQKCTILQGRKVYLYPDLNAFDAWEAKTHELKLIANFILFPLLEQIANPQQRIDGLDIADYLMGLWPL